MRNINVIAKQHICGQGMIVLAGTPGVILGSGEGLHFAGTAHDPPAPGDFRVDVKWDVAVLQRADIGDKASVVVPAWMLTGIPAALLEFVSVDVLN